MNTIMLKAAVVSVEWDKKNNKILYLGTMNSSLVKVYDINLKKVIQDLELNKSFAHVTHICSLSLNGIFKIKTKIISFLKLLVNFERSQNRISNYFLINIIELYSNFSKFKKN
jgi:hypothetical protein